MQYQSDYILRLVEQMGDLIRRAMSALQLGDHEASFEYAEQVIALATDIDPGLVPRLAPHSLASLLEMSNLDDRVIAQVADALDVQAESLESMGELVESNVRRQQSAAVRGLIGPQHAN